MARLCGVNTCVPLMSLSAVLPIEMSDPFADRQRLAAANINPVTGLTTDYLNHFNEAIMLIEMLPDFPDIAADLDAWETMSYRAHFEQSRFRDRELAIAAYEAAPCGPRGEFDRLCDVMSAKLIEARDALDQAIDQNVKAMMAEEIVEELRDLVSHAGAVVNGTADTTQANIDQLMNETAA